MTAEVLHTNLQRLTEYRHSSGTNLSNLRVRGASPVAVDAMYKHYRATDWKSAAAKDTKTNHARKGEASVKKSLRFLRLPSRSQLV